MKNVGYQGVPGAYSSIAAEECFPKLRTHGYATFEEVVRAAQAEAVTYALLPIENSTSGRVADIHHLLPGSGLRIVGEHFLPIRHCLIGLSGARVKDIRYVYSHREALGQCAQYIRSRDLVPVPFGDTAGAVAFIAEEKRPDCAALASDKAASLFPTTTILERNVQDKKDNVTRFLIVTKTEKQRPVHHPVITSIVYRTRDIPAALFKSLAGFATTSTNIIKIESFIPMARHTDAHFYVEFEGHPTDTACAVALEELRFFTRNFEILGTYEKSPYRSTFRRKS